MTFTSPSPRTDRYRPGGAPEPVPAAGAPAGAPAASGAPAVGDPVSFRMLAGVTSSRLGELAFACPEVHWRTPVPDVESLFRRDRSLRAVVVHTPGGPSLLTRTRLLLELSGPLGYGRALNTRSRVVAVLPDDVLALPAETSLGETAGLILARPSASRYEDFLVVDTLGRTAAASPSAVFEYLSRVLGDMATHDVLTGLPNREYLEQHAARLLVGGADPARWAALFVDLDGFKQVNDQLGHHAGDELLASFALRLGRVMGRDDVATRLGGDEFAALLVGVDEAGAAEVAEQVLIGATTPFALDGRTVTVSASVGVALARDLPPEDAPRAPGWAGPGATPVSGRGWRAATAPHGPGSPVAHQGGPGTSVTAPLQLPRPGARHAVADPQAEAVRVVGALLRTADHAMLHAKRTGKGRAVRAGAA